MGRVLLSKEDFIRYMNSLRNASDLCDEIDSIIKLMGDDEIYSDIEYFIYELDYGRKYKKGMITDRAGNDMSLATPEGLYDYLVSLSNKK